MLLYHGTTIDRAVNILNSGRIAACQSFFDLDLNTKPCVCMTRHAHLRWSGFGAAQQPLGLGAVQLVAQRQVLRQRLRVAPFNYSYHRRESATRIAFSHEIAEERVYGDIPLNFIERVEVFIPRDRGRSDGMAYFGTFAAVALSRLEELCELKRIQIKFIQTSDFDERLDRLCITDIGDDEIYPLF